MGKLIGYKYIHSKKSDKDFCVATVLSELSEREKHDGKAFGQKSEDIFMPDDLFNYLKPEHIGKEFVPEYSISNGRAFLVNVTIK